MAEKAERLVLSIEWTDNLIIVGSNRPLPRNFEVEVVPIEVDVRAMKGCTAQLVRPWLSRKMDHHLNMQLAAGVGLAYPTHDLYLNCTNPTALANARTAMDEAEGDKVAFLEQQLHNWLFDPKARTIFDDLTYYDVLQVGADIDRDVSDCVGSYGARPIFALAESAAAAA